MSRFNTILGLSIVVAGAAFIKKVSDYNKTSYANDFSNKSSDSKVDKTNRNENDLDARAQKMYKDLSMTKNQKERYVASIRDVKDNWTKKYPNMPMDDNSLLSEEDKSLSAVLDEVQYGMYRDWAKKYAY